MKNNDYNARAQQAIEGSNQVGAIQKAYGTAGELVVKLWDNFPEDITEPLWVEIDTMAVPLFVKTFDNQGLSKAVVVFDDFEDQATARILIGLKIFSEQAEQLETQTDEQWTFLEGFELVDQTSNKKGIVITCIDSELNPLLDVDFQGVTHLVPIDEKLVVKVDKKRKTITLKLPDGIFDLANLEE